MHDAASPQVWNPAVPAMAPADYPKCSPVVLGHLEGIARAAMGIEAIADVLFQHNIEIDKGVVEDGAPLRMRTVEGLARALGCLAELVASKAHRCAKEVNHG